MPGPAPGVAGVVAFGRPLADGSVAVAVVNLRDAAGDVAVALAPEALGLDPARAASAKDVWAGTARALAPGAPVQASVAPHATALFIVSSTTVA